MAKADEGMKPGTFLGILTCGFSLGLILWVLLGYVVR